MSKVVAILLAVAITATAHGGGLVAEGSHKPHPLPAFQPSPYAEQGWNEAGLCEPRQNLPNGDLAGTCEYHGPGWPGGPGWQNRHGYANVTWRLDKGVLVPISAVRCFTKARQGTPPCLAFHAD